MTEADRAVLSDDGNRLALTCYGGGERMAVVKLDPLRAMALASDLIVAAHRLLARGKFGARRRGQRSPMTTVALRRGDVAIARLRAEFFADLGITKAADEIAAHGRRYETTRWRKDSTIPVAEIADAKARLCAEVLLGRRHFPGSRRIRGVLRETNSGAIHFPNSAASGDA